jgi:hypothetical protein
VVSETELSTAEEDTEHGIPPATHGWSRALKFQPAKTKTKKNREQLETH